MLCRLPAFAFFDQDGFTLNFDPPTSQLGLNGPVHSPAVSANYGFAFVFAGGIKTLGPADGYNFMTKPTAVVSLTWVRGNHTYKAGADGRWEGYPITNFSGTDGEPGFSAATGQPI